MIRERLGTVWSTARGSWVLDQNDCRMKAPIFDELSEAIPGITLKAA
jgi:hypothetical protein